MYEDNKLSPHGHQTANVGSIQGEGQEGRAQSQVGAASTGRSVRDYRRTRLEKGIYQTQYGYEVIVHASGTHSKRFPRGTTIQTLRAWAAETKAKHKRYTYGPGLVNERFPRGESGWCYVYFISNGNEVKIGKAVDPESRLAAHQTSSERKLFLLAAVPFHASLEPVLHAHFANLKVNGEWFAITPELLEYIGFVSRGGNPLWPIWEDALVRSKVDGSQVIRNKGGYK